MELTSQGCTVLASAMKLMCDCANGDSAALCSGDVSIIPGGVTFDPSQLTLTCISTGGPATTVTWTRNNVNITGDPEDTVLNDPVTARYTHSLTLTTAGVYRCTVANNKPSSASSASTTVAGSKNVHKSQLFCVWPECMAC